MVDPIWFATRMQGVALVPEPLWWLLGAIVSFYFGARHHVKNQQFQKQVAASLALAPTVMNNLDALEGIQRTRAVQPAKMAPVVQTPQSQKTFPNNAALQDWVLLQR